MHAFHHPKAFAAVTLPSARPRFSKLLQILRVGFVALASSLTLLLEACYSCVERTFFRVFLQRRESPLLVVSPDDDNDRDLEDQEGDRELEEHRHQTEDNEIDTEPDARASALILKALAFNVNRKDGQAKHAEPSPFSFLKVCKGSRTDDKQQHIGIGMVTADISVEADNVLRGYGLVLASAPMEQDKVYFEVRVVTPGRLLVGATRYPAASVPKWSDANYDSLLLQDKSASQSFVEFGNLNGVAVKQDDIISCAFNQADMPTSLELAVNGVPFPACTLTGLRGEVWPALVLRDCAEAQFIFDSGRCCHFDPYEARGFKALLLSRSLIG